MRTVFTLVGMLLALNIYSQKNDPQVTLSKGQKFSIKTSSTQEADMGMGMEMKNNSSSQNDFYVIDINGNDYTLSSTLTGLKMSIDFMGQQSNYDSDLKEDTASEIGKTVKNLNKPDTLTVNKLTGTASSNKKIEIPADSIPANPMETLLESLGAANTDISVSEAFFVIPAGKKAGDSWTDSSSTKEQKTLKKFTLNSVNKNIATIIIAGTTESNIQSEVQGLQVSVTMTTKTRSEITADIKTSLVMKRITNSEITGNMELMGQSAPITGKASTTSIYEY